MHFEDKAHTICVCLVVAPTQDDRKRPSRVGEGAAHKGFLEATPHGVIGVLASHGMRHIHGQIPQMLDAPFVDDGTQGHPHCEPAMKP